MVFLGSTPIGGPTVGLIIDAFGPRAGVAVGGLACLGAAAWGHRAMGRAAGEVVPVDGDDTDQAEAPTLTLTD